MKDKGAGDATRMAVCRTILAILIALAVGVAPVGAALAAAHTSPKPAMQDCHGKAPVHCPHCDKDKIVNKNKCPGDGSKCCKLVGALSSVEKVTRPLTEPQQLPEPRRLTGWRLQPQPPPPRSWSQQCAPPRGTQCVPRVLVHCARATQAVQL